MIDIKETGNTEAQHLILVWDCLLNQEVSNFSIDKDYSFVNGVGTKSGYLLNDTVYINLDEGLINYFYEYPFQA